MPDKTFVSPSHCQRGAHDYSGWENVDSRDKAPRPKELFFDIGLALAGFLFIALFAQIAAS